MILTGWTTTRVFLTCVDSKYCETHRDFFQAQHDFVVCGEGKNDFSILKDVTELVPDLVVMEVDADPIPADNLNIAGSENKQARGSAFVVLERDDIQVEKEVLARGVDAVFEKDQVPTSLRENARAICKDS
jgi:DNA-binding NarL/FixJ family response regulator